MLREIVTMFAVLSVSLGQTTTVIDITDVVPRNRTKEPTVVSASVGKVGGGVGTPAEESPIEAKILWARMAKGAEEPTLIFQIRLRNASREKLAIPINPNLADFEPARAGTSYSYSSAHVFLVLDQTKSILQGVTLYGSNAISGSFADLPPGGSVEIRARTSLTPVNPNAALPLPSHLSVKAGILMQNAVVIPQDDSLREELRQIGPEVISANAVIVVPAA